MRRPRLAAFLGAAVVAVTVLAGPAAQRAAAEPAPTLSSPKADIVVDAGTGRVLVGDNVHEPVHPASTAKIMTALTAVERLCPGSAVTADALAANIEPMRIGLPAGTTWPFDQMMASLMMVSANDAAYSFAHTIGGSLDGFAADLAATAKQLGLRDSTLNDPAGLDDEMSYKGGPLMSAYDLAIATRNALAAPEIAKWAAMREFLFVDPAGNQHRLVNHNKMLPGGAYGYPGAIGFKTGFTNRSQHTLVAAATRDGRTLIAVVLGVPDAGYAEAASLLDAGFATAPDAAGTGETLPPVAVSRCADRAADQAAFMRLGPTGGTPAAAAGVTVPASIPSLDQPPPAAPTTAAARTSNVAGATTKSTKQSGGLFGVRTFVVVLVLLLGVAFVLRRRAVKRQRAMRLARRRQRISAMRSGGLPVVDGRYRSGTRIGPPVESHVRVRPLRRGQPGGR